MKNKIKEKSKGIEDRIFSFLPKIEGTYQTVLEAMEYSVCVGGKRLRPMLLEESYRLFGGKNYQEILPFMTAIEMIHTYSLVHDDLPAMDNDMLRRGKPTTHAVYGEAMGILTGDALLNYGFEVALQGIETMEHSQNGILALKILASKSGVFGMIGGQVIDMEAEASQNVSLELIEEIYLLKTSALIEAAMMMGAVLAGATKEEVALIEQVARNIGLAFQIQDDILDQIGSEEVLGKPIGSDEKNQKCTYVSFVGLEEAQNQVQEFTNQGLELLQSLPFENEFLTELLRYLIYREQ